MRDLAIQFAAICVFQILVGFGLGHLLYLYLRRKKQKPKEDR